MLCAKFVNTEKTEGGSLHIRVGIQPIQETTVQNLPAVIDGAMLARVSINGQAVDECRLVLPLNGIDTQHGAVLEGLCTKMPSDFRPEDCEVALVADRMWLIERISLPGEETQIVKTEEEKEEDAFNALLQQTYDVYICCMETNEAGERTVEGIMGRDLCKRLEKAGHKVFLPGETICSIPERKQQPLIDSALKQAKVMVLVGTRRESYDDPRIRPIWGRFLEQIESGVQKKLIPCFRDMAEDDLPDELIRNQPISMNDIAFMGELLGEVQGFMKNME